MAEASDIQARENEGVQRTQTPVAPLADIVSLESVVNVLIRKGLCSPDELFEEERMRREYNKEVKDLSIVSTGRSSNNRTPHKDRRKKQSWLKLKMSQKKWTRRLGTSLFGWQWKKVKHEKKSYEIQNHHSEES